MMIQPNTDMRTSEDDWVGIVALMLSFIATNPVKRFIITAFIQLKREIDAGEGLC